MISYQKTKTQEENIRKQTRKSKFTGKNTKKTLAVTYKCYHYSALPYKSAALAPFSESSRGHITPDCT